MLHQMRALWALYILMVSTNLRKLNSLYILRHFSFILTSRQQNVVAINWSCSFRLWQMSVLQLMYNISPIFQIQNDRNIYDQFNQVVILSTVIYSIMCWLNAGACGHQTVQLLPLSITHCPAQGLLLPFQSLIQSDS